MKNILIIGCGLIGSSVLRAISHYKVAKTFLCMKNQNLIYQKLKN